jgi:nitrogen regulatory protein P-II 1
MKLITAIVKPDKLHEVMHAVAGAGARGLTATEVRGFGQQYGHREVTAGPADREVLSLPKLRVDVVVQDEIAGSVAAAIAKAVSTGTVGDGKIWVTTVDSVLRIRTGERDRDAV